MTAAVDETLERSLDTGSILVRQLLEMWESLVEMIPGIIIASVVLLVTWVLSRYATRIAGIFTRRSHMRPSLQALIETIARIAVWIFGILIALTVLLPGLTPTSLIAGLGIGTVAIGFAFQDIFENFVAGVFIMARKKMRLGDYIVGEGFEGTVEGIKLRETHIRKLSRELLIVPNAEIFKNNLEIYTDEDLRRHEIVTGVDYETDLETARTIIYDAVKSAEGVNTDKPVEVFASEFNASSIDFIVRWWSGSRIPDMLKSRDSVIRKIKIALDDAGIVIPFPQTTLSFKETVPLPDSSSGRSSQS